MLIRTVVTALAAFGAAACGSTSPDPSAFGAPDAAGATPDGATFTFGDSSSTIPPADSGAGGGIAIPANFVATEFGGYALGTPIMGDGSTAGLQPPSGGGAKCSVLLAVIRDFKGSNMGGHPDFEPNYTGMDVTPGLVAGPLGVDLKPVYGAQCEAGAMRGPTCPYGQMMTTKANFDQWYRYTAGVNMPYLLFLKFGTNGNLLTFESQHYFPLDGAGWGNSGTGDDGKMHNFGFTTEVHTLFQYNGGETFTFIGDDDVWVFMNGKLAVDLGGIHPAASKTITLDTAASGLGLVKGSTYPLELFQAERHTVASTFRIDTNLAFTNCGTIPPDVPK